MRLLRTSLLAALLLGTASPLVACQASTYEGSSDAEVSAQTPLTQLLAGVPLGTKWADVAPSVKAALAKKAELLRDDRYARFSASALEEKERTLLDAPTPAMTAYFNQMVIARYGADLPEPASAYVASEQIENANLLAALKKLYLLESATSRDEAIRSVDTGGDRVPALDWDGVSPIHEAVLPDDRLISDHSAYASSILAEVRRIIADSQSGSHPLSPVEARIAARTESSLRVFATDNPYDASSSGGFGFYRTYAILGMSMWFTFARTQAGGAIFLNDDTYLEAMNGFWFGPKPRNLDKGSLKSLVEYHLTIGYASDASVKRLVGDPAENALAKATVLMRDWWIERLQASADAQNRCTLWTSDEQDRQWDAFAASGGVAPGTTLESVGESTLGLERTAKASMEPMLRDALAHVFPDETIVTAAQRSEVVARVMPTISLGTAQAQTAAALDAVTGAQAASAKFDAAMNAVKYIGYGTTPGAQVTDEDRATLEPMWQEVRTWLSERYASAPGPHHPASALPTTVTISMASNSTTNVADGSITIGLGSAPRVKMGWYGIMIHEAMHAFTVRSRLKPEGLNIEGAAQSAERKLTPIFMKEKLAASPGELGLASLHWLLGSARNVSITKTTIALLQRKSCGPSEPDTIELAYAFGKEAGLSGVSLDTVVYRAHQGTAYLQYVAGELINQAALDYLDEKIRPGVSDDLDMYRLVNCGIANPKKDDATVAKLRACLGH